MPNYQNGKIYCIRSHQTDDIYIGSTTQKLCVRMAGHRKDYKRFINNKTHYYTSFDLCKYDDAYIELLEEYKCNNKEELEKREGEIIRSMDCINKLVVGRTKQEYDKEYYKINKKKLKEYQKTYKLNPENMKKIKECKKEYNKIKITCCCGSIILKCQKLRHEKSQKHIKLMEEINKNK